VARPILEIAEESGSAAWRLARRRVVDEWRALPLPAIGVAAPRRVLAYPIDRRPPDESLGAAIIEGRFTLEGATSNGDPWDRASPSRDFAVALHRFGWLSALTEHGEAGAREALRLMQGWDRAFGRYNAFAWSAEVLERRVFNWACALKAVSDVRRRGGRKRAGVAGAAGTASAGPWRARGARGGAGGGGGGRRRRPSMRPRTGGCSSLR
jgi:uncharacterized heparinase superfamily protein